MLNFTHLYQYMPNCQNMSNFILTNHKLTYWFAKLLVQPNLIVYSIHVASMLNLYAKKLTFLMIIVEFIVSEPLTITVKYTIRTGLEFKNIVQFVISTGDQYPLLLHCLPISTPERKSGCNSEQSWVTNTFLLLVFQNSAPEKSLVQANTIKTESYLTHHLTSFCNYVRTFKFFYWYNQTSTMYVCMYALTGYKISNIESLPCLVVMWAYYLHIFYCAKLFRLLEWCVISTTTSIEWDNSQLCTSKFV